MIDFGEMKGKKWEGRIRSFDALKIKSSENGKGSINWNSVLVEWNWFHIALLLEATILNYKTKLQLCTNTDLKHLCSSTLRNFVFVEEKFKELDSDQIEVAEFEFLDLETRFERNMRLRF